jgi:hypothetical protein
MACPKCGNAETKIPVSSSVTPSALPGGTGPSKKTTLLHIVCESLVLKTQGKPIPPNIKNADIFDYLPDRVRINSILEGTGLVLLHPSQIIPKKSILIENVEMDASKLHLMKKDLEIKLNGSPISSDRFELILGDRMEINSILIYLEAV